MPDAINPSHYKGERWECIEIIEAHGLDHFRATALAYILRAARKNGEEDLRKALWYLRRLANSPMNLANAISFAVTDPARAIEMTGAEVAADFGILECKLGEPSYLRKAVIALVPYSEEFTSAAALLEDINYAIAVIEAHLDTTAKAFQS
jgi:hypothetical protein